MQTDTQTQCEDSKPELRDTQGHQKLAEMHRTNPVATFILDFQSPPLGDNPIAQAAQFGSGFFKSPSRHKKRKDDTLKSPQAPIKSLSGAGHSSHNEPGT